MASPLGAAYEVSKYGVEAFSDVLRRVGHKQGHGESFSLICYTIESFQKLLFLEIPYLIDNSIILLYKSFNGEETNIFT